MAVKQSDISPFDKMWQLALICSHNNQNYSWTSLRKKHHNNDRKTAKAFRCAVKLQEPWKLRLKQKHCTFSDLLNGIRDAVQPPTDPLQLRQPFLKPVPRSFTVSHLYQHGALKPPDIPVHPVQMVPALLDVLRHLLLDFVQLRYDLVLGVSWWGHKPDERLAGTTSSTGMNVCKEPGSPRSVMTLPCFCTVCSRPFRVSLMELKVRMTSDSSPCRVFSWLLLEPPITLWPSKGFSPSSRPPLVPPLPPPEPPPV